MDARTPAKTCTGGIAIGFRRGWSPWQRDLAHLVQWANDNAFACVDLGNDGEVAGPEVLAEGGRIGSVDLPEWKGMISSDPATRKAAVLKNTAYIEMCAGFGVLLYFTVIGAADRFFTARFVLRHCGDSDALDEALRDRYRAHLNDFVVAGILVQGQAGG